MMEILAAEPDAKTDPGSEEWCKRIRKKARNVAREWEQTYLVMAELLYTIYDTPVGGDRKNIPVWQAWGYTNFGDYVEDELGIHRKKAQRLRHIWWRLAADDLKTLDPELRKRLIALGMSKVRELLRVLTPQNAEKWIDMAENGPFTGLDAAIAKALEVASHKAAVHGETDVDAEGSNGSVEPPAGSETAAYLRFALYPEQYGNVMLALKRASEMCQSDKRGHCLDMICTDFLATNDFKGENDPDQQLLLFAKFERLFKKRVVVVDPKERRIVYGLDALELVATEDD
jgi:hypothetical protein